MAFIDVEKAFDSVPWRPLFEHLRRLGIKARLVRALMSFYREEGNTYIEIDGLKSRDVVIGNGVMQGSAHGPLCFNLYYDIVIRLLNRSPDATKSVMVHDTPVITRAFADDLLLLSKSVNHLEELLRRMDRYLK